MVSGTKIKRESWAWAGKWAIFTSRGTGRPCATERRLDSGHCQDVGAQIGAGRECADAIDAGVGADGLAQPPLQCKRTASRGKPNLIATFLVF